MKEMSTSFFFFTVYDTPKSFKFILWPPWMSSHHSILIFPEVVDILVSQESDRLILISLERHRLKILSGYCLPHANKSTGKEAEGIHTWIWMRQCLHESTSWKKNSSILFTTLLPRPPHTDCFNAGINQAPVPSTTCCTLYYSRLL